MRNLLSKGETNAKLIKNIYYGYRSYVLYLSPFTLNEKGINVCPKASVACAMSCLNSAGRGAFSNVQDARRKKTEFLLIDRIGFLTQLWKELTNINKRSKGNVTVRLNGTSDLDWHKMFSLIGKDLFSLINIQFYDYTKVASRLAKYKGTNYHLTFSRSESNESDTLKALQSGGNVAVVFGGKELPKKWNGYTVVNGDESDLRFLDPANVVVGLKAKGKAKKDTSGFVVMA